MNLIRFSSAKRRFCPKALFCVVIASALAVAPYWLAAQAPSPDRVDTVKVIHLANAAQISEANDVVTALRNMLDPHARIYLHGETNDVLISAPPDQIALAARLIGELDHPKRTYRVTYTLNESDNGKRIGVQHFSMVAVTGQRITLKQGDKVPVATGSFNTDQAAQQTQFTYLDVGINLDTTLDQFANGLRLRSKVEQSSVAAGPQTGKLADDPIVRQSVLEGTSVFNDWYTI